MMIHRVRLAATLLLLFFACGFVACVRETLDTLPGNETVKSNAEHTDAPLAAESRIPETELTTETEPAATVPETEPEVPGMTLHFYGRNRAAGVREMIGDCIQPWIAGSDISTFSTFFSADQTISASAFSDVWRGCAEKIPGSDVFRIGYAVEFSLKGTGEKHTMTILKPDDLGQWFDWLEIYLYDDVHQVPGAWYSHLLSSEFTEETLLSSIKLTAGKRIEELGDTITLTAFAYRSDLDFDASGSYIGAYQTTVTITKQ